MNKINISESIGKDLTKDIHTLETALWCIDHWKGKYRKLNDKLNNQIFFKDDEGEIKQMPKYLVDNIEDGHVTILGREYEIECDCSEEDQEWIQEDGEIGIYESRSVCENCNRTNYK